MRHKLICWLQTMNPWSQRLLSFHHTLSSSALFSVMSGGVGTGIFRLSASEFVGWLDGAEAAFSTAVEAHFMKVISDSGELLFNGASSECPINCFKQFSSASLPIAMAIRTAFFPQGLAISSVNPDAKLSLGRPSETKTRTGGNARLGIGGMSNSLANNFIAAPMSVP